MKLRPLFPSAPRHSRARSLRNQSIPKAKVPDVKAEKMTFLQEQIRTRGSVGEAARKSV